MFRRVPQPTVVPGLRDPERHSFWPGFVGVLIGLVFLLAGARHLTGVETTDGDNAWETQLMKAFANGGLRYPGDEPPPPPPPPRFDDPAANAEALDRWARQNAQAEAPKWKVRVDIGANTPCPT